MNRFSVWNRLASIAILVVYTSNRAMAVPPPDESPPSWPPTVSATIYSTSQVNLAWGASTDNKAVTGYYLQRCQPGSCQSPFLVGTSPRTYSATGLTPGITYTFYVWARDAAGNESDSNSAVATLAGGPPPQTDSLANQINYVYETRLGDLNGDNLIDVYVYRTSGGTAGNGALDQFILQQIAGGKFTTIVPTSAQTTTASGWAPNSINKAADDINWDGHADLILQVSKKVPGALDQIVYAPAQLSVSTPKGIKAVDADFRKFLKDFSNWVAKPNYFATGTSTSPQPIFGVGQQCISYCDYSHSNVHVCFNYPIVVGFTNGSSSFSQPALNFGQIVNQAGSGELGASGTSALKQILDTQLGVSTGLGLVNVGNPIEWVLWTNAERNLWLVRLLSRLAIISTVVLLEGDMSPTIYYHYTPAVNVPPILASGQLISPSGGFIFLTKTVYESKSLAWEQLALPVEPGAGIVVTSDDMRPIQPTFGGPVLPRYGKSGGGFEWIRVSPISLSLWPRVFYLLP